MTPALRWSWGSVDGQPARVHFGCGGEVWVLEGGHICRVCGEQDDGDELEGEHHATAGPVTVTVRRSPDGPSVYVAHCAVCGAVRSFDSPGYGFRSSAEWASEHRASHRPPAKVRRRLVISVGLVIA